MEKIISWYRGCGREVSIGAIVGEMGIVEFRSVVLGEQQTEEV